MPDSQKWRPLTVPSCTAFSLHIPVGEYHYGLLYSARRWYSPLFCFIVSGISAEVPFSLYPTLPVYFLLHL